MRLFQSCFFLRPVVRLRPSCAHWTTCNMETIFSRISGISCFKLSTWSILSWFELLFFCLRPSKLLVSENFGWIAVIYCLGWLFVCRTALEQLFSVLFQWTFCYYGFFFTKIMLGISQGRFSPSPQVHTKGKVGSVGKNVEKWSIRLIQWQLFHKTLRSLKLCKMLSFQYTQSRAPAADETKTEYMATKDAIR